MILPSSIIHLSAGPKENSRFEYSNITGYDTVQF